MARKPQNSEKIDQNVLTNEGACDSVQQDSVKSDQKDPNIQSGQSGRSSKSGNPPPKSKKLTSAERRKKIEQKRKTRTPMVDQPLINIDVEDHEGYKIRVFEDDGDRIRKAELAGWEKVETGITGLSSQASQMGKTAEVDLGQGRKGYVMRIEEELFNEDQERKLSKRRKNFGAAVAPTQIDSELLYGEIRVRNRTYKPGRDF